MPAILRIFVYQTDASQSVIGSTDPYGVIVVPPCGPRQRHVGLQHYEVLSVWVRWGGSGLRPSLLEISITDVLGITQEA